MAGYSRPAKKPKRPGLRGKATPAKRYQPYSTPGRLRVTKKGQTMASDSDNDGGM